MFARTSKIHKNFVSLLVIGAILIRWCVSLHSYSGSNKPPLYGDYEAQRHWMEVTYNLPLSDWYHNTTNNDLMYWGLDYPPLTAYHSYLCGWVASLVNPNYVALHSSRGYESYNHKLFMRGTVLLADVLVYLPAMYWFFSNKQLFDSLQNHMNRKSNKRFSQNKLDKHINNMFCGLFIALNYPGLILIDNGHFQYNSVSLGLFIAAVAAILRGKDLIGSLFYCLALNYKQMELYHSLPFFCYLLGKCVQICRQSFAAGIKTLVSISLVVAVTFFVIWIPLLTSFDSLLQVLHRLFPVARGVFEDKVANLWCSVNIVFKLRNSFTNSTMAHLCILVTLLAVIPTCVDLLLRPRPIKFLLCLINSSLAFFLFSFQVHEKSILLVAVPMILYLTVEPIPCVWFLTISVFSMLPLLIKDGLVIPTIALMVFYIIVFGLTLNFDDRPNIVACKNETENILDLRPVIKPKKKNEKPHLYYRPSYLKPVSLHKYVYRIVFTVYLLICFILTISNLMLRPPTRYPDLFPLMISVFSCFHFVCFLLYFNYRQIVYFN